MSYDNRLGNFGGYVAILKNVPEYKPNETDLKLTGLNATLADLQAKNNAVSSTFVPLSQARGVRDNLLYTGRLRSEHGSAGQGLCKRRSWPEQPVEQADQRDPVPKAAEVEIVSFTRHAEPASFRLLRSPDGAITGNEAPLSEVEALIPPVEVAVSGTYAFIPRVEVVVLPVEAPVLPVEVPVLPMEVAVLPVEVPVLPVEVAVPSVGTAILSDGVQPPASDIKSANAVAEVISASEFHARSGCRDIEHNCTCRRVPRGI